MRRNSLYLYFIPLQKWILSFNSVPVEFLLSQQKPNSNSIGYWDVSVETQKDLYWENAIQKQLTPVYWNSLENQLTKLIRLKHTLWRAIFFSAAHCVCWIKTTRLLLCFFIIHWHFYWVQSIKSQQGFNGQNSTEYQMTSFNWNSIEFLLTKIK